MTTIEVFNHQEVIKISTDLLAKWTHSAQSALPLALKNSANGGGVLGDLEEVEISIVDDETIAQVHVDFMDIPGATDVITFAHGEVVISAETACANASEYGSNFEKELMLYIIHGLLHLSGHEDEEANERHTMEKIQSEILSTVW